MEGQLQTRKWQGQDGVDKYTTEIVLGNFKGELQMLDTRSGGGGDYAGGGGGGDQGYAEQAPMGPGGGAGGGDDLDDEIPF